MSRVTEAAFVVRLSVGSEPHRQPDWLAVEEPLELRVGGRSLAVTMRTPGSDFDLAAGFVLSEGVVTTREQLATIRYCAGDGSGNSFNLVDLALAPGVAPPDLEALRRTFFTTSSCGLCGKASIDTVRTRSAYEVRADPLVVDPAVLVALPERLRAAQKVFERTGGLHAAALFDRSGDLLVLREDVGRHNAVDKVLGWALREGRVPLRGTILAVSGRASFELVQKALMAGIPLLCAVSAPSSLAVGLAAESGMTLVGFLRSPSMVIYSAAQRLGLAQHLAPERSCRVP
ncbi:MAG: formate dehydrogenase accessory sulfurtransferase FdhD [Acidimicrobiales bacterium]